MEAFVFDLSVVLVGAALLSIAAVFLKQPIIIAYIACGAIIGPWGAGWIKNAEFIEIISHVGITLLLFLAGLCLHPQKLLGIFKRTSLVTLANCIASFAIAFPAALLFKFTMTESICVGLALMFSSTILAVKLLPTTRLHHEKMGAVCIGVLILEDILAIIVLALIRSLHLAQNVALDFGLLVVKLIALIALIVLIEHFVLRKIIARIDRWHEALFILGLAWCFGIAGISNKLGLYYETGAFFAGVVLARHPIALFISEKLKPLRDFFLVLFFFTLGAKLDFLVMKNILLPAAILAVIFTVLKPWLFKRFFIVAGEARPFAREAGIRLGQLSEFSLLIAFLAFELGHIGAGAAQLIQLVTIITIIVSSYIVVFSYPTPIGTSEKLIRD